MFEVGVTAHFEASHRLRGPFGPAAEKHSHQYRIDLTVRGTELGEDGTLSDVATLQTILDECALALHHRDLDDLPSFQGRNSTAENVARHLYDEVGLGIQSARVIGWCVRVWESSLVWASFDGGRP